jgi:membrane protein DedA with SNARE-associated domain
MWMLAGLAVGTLLSEDAALAGAAGLTRTGLLPPLAAGAAVALAIWVGDLALFCAGRFAVRWRPLGRMVERRWPRTELHALAARLERRAGLAILLSRVLPGTRVPLYVAAGAFQLRPATFAACTAVGVLLWTGAILAAAWWLP